MSGDDHRHEDMGRLTTARDRTTILLAAIDAAGIPNDTALLDIREENGYLNVLCPADLRVLLDALKVAEVQLAAARSALAAVREVRAAGVGGEAS